MADHHGAFDTSVCEKSLPLKRSGSPEVRARAYEKQSPKFHGRRLAALAIIAEFATPGIHLVRSHCDNLNLRFVQQQIQFSAADAAVARLCDDGRFED